MVMEWRNAHGCNYRHLYLLLHLVVMTMGASRNLSPETATDAARPRVTIANAITEKAADILGEKLSRLPCCRIKKCREYE